MPGNKQTRRVRRRPAHQADQGTPEANASSLTTTPLAIVPTMFQDAQNTSIRNATFIICGSTPPPSDTTGSGEELSQGSSSEYRSRALPPNDVLLRTPQTGPEIYVRHLTTKNRGYPLWIPSPNLKLSTSYRAAGVRVGDVGVITPQGAFSFFFNVCHEATHPINVSMRLPPDFVPFTPSLSECDIEEFIESSTGSYLADESVARVGTNSSPREIVLKTSSTKAAVLMMPEPVYASKLQSIALLRKYVHRNLKGWYRFLRNELGRDVDNGELRVVYGCQKSSAYGIAAISNGTAETDTELTFSTDDSVLEGAGSQYRWSHKGAAEVKAGPSSTENDDVRRTRETHFTTDIVNQCLFISSLDFTLPQCDWERIDADDSLSITTRSSVSESGSAPSTFSAESNGSHSASTSSSVTDREGKTGAHVLSESIHLSAHEVSKTLAVGSQRLFHPSDVLAAFLRIVVAPTTSVAISSDDWGPYMAGLNSSRLGNDIWPFIRSVLAANIVVEDEGFVHLSPLAELKSHAYGSSVNGDLHNDPLTRNEPSPVQTIQVLNAALSTKHEPPSIFSCSTLPSTSNVPKWRTTPATVEISPEVVATRKGPGSSRIRHPESELYRRLELVNGLLPPVGEVSNIPHGNGWTRWVLDPVHAFDTLLLPPVLFCVWKLLTLHISIAQGWSNPFGNFFLLNGSNPTFPQVHPLYHKTFWDLGFIAYYVIFFSFLRQFFLGILPHIARCLGLGNNWKDSRFGMQFYLILHSTVFSVCGLYVCRQLLIRGINFFDFSQDYPWPFMEGIEKRYYLMRLAHLCQELIAFDFAFDFHAVGNSLLVLQGVLTIVSIGGLYCANMTPIGTIVLISMDVPNVFLGLCKFFSYSKRKRAAAASFLAFFIFWLNCRHFLHWQILPFFWKVFEPAGSWASTSFPSKATWMPWWAKWLIFIPLIVLQGIDLYWFTRILKILFTNLPQRTSKQI